MKKYLYLSVALLTTLSLGACGDDDEPGSGSAANVQFSASSYTLDDEPIEIKVVASQAAASNLNIGFTVGGTATTADYELSAQSFLLEAGKTEATVTVTPKQAYKEAKTLTFNLAAGKGYVIGAGRFHDGKSGRVERLCLQLHDGGGRIAGVAGCYADRGRRELQGA